MACSTITWHTVFARDNLVRTTSSSQARACAVSPATAEAQEAPAAIWYATTASPNRYDGSIFARRRNDIMYYLEHNFEQDCLAIPKARAPPSSSLESNTSPLSQRSVETLYVFEMISVVREDGDRNAHQGSALLSDTPNQTARRLLIDTGGSTID